MHQLFRESNEFIKSVGVTYLLQTSKLPNELVSESYSLKNHNEERKWYKSTVFVSLSPAHYIGRRWPSEWACRLLDSLQCNIFLDYGNLFSCEDLHTRKTKYSELKTAKILKPVRSTSRHGARAVYHADEYPWDFARKSLILSGIASYVSDICRRPRSGREGEKCRPLDHMRHIPFTRKALFTSYTKVSVPYLFSLLFLLYGIDIMSWYGISCHNHFTASSLWYWDRSITYSVALKKSFSWNKEVRELTKGCSTLNTPYTTRLPLFERKVLKKNNTGYWLKTFAHIQFREIKILVPCVEFYRNY